MKNKHFCWQMKQALNRKYVNSNGVGYFLKNEEDFNIAIYYCPFCGNKLTNSNK